MNLLTVGVAGGGGEGEKIPEAVYFLNLVGEKARRTPKHREVHATKELRAAGLRSDFCSSGFSRWWSSAFVAERGEPEVLISPFSPFFCSFGA